jgi:hypothetical protein
MIKLPKFMGRSRGPLEEDEDGVCRKQLGTTYHDIQSLLGPLGHHLAGRVQRYRGADCPCIYVFYNRMTFENGQRGLMYLTQNLEGGGFKIVLRTWKSHPPIGEKKWRELATPSARPVAGSGGHFTSGLVATSRKRNR